ncbi:isocitrate/isopropylmalate family dehydrogenase [Collinsella tanakaei]|uniref:isocitrate/isopropylmalate family dehydrogenase n=1 Tax=Collinsella tanakaei TaxID=626935 RepID=UPI001F3ED9C2|nr:isocitrate/isopropylmalate family dehydrogenase [Collinsella tanakaei]MCF2621397.1 isocitrate/isopropylmalate dehydrogenase family protein [Collinsella tanakaei]MDM8302849.1 isocitrate/isopropylmalate family dehydrogenase [Collinsella tanakaei]
MNAADQEAIERATKRFGELIAGELERIERVRQDGAPKDYTKLDHITIGILPGDGIGPTIVAQAVRVLECLLADQIESGRVELRHIEGLTIERRAALGESLPQDVLDAALECDVLLKGPLTTPRPGDPYPNLVSANSLLRRGLDLFVGMRPIRMADKGIDWTFFRENLEGEYIWGDKGIQVTDDLAVDFKVCTLPGTERLARMALNYARANGKTTVTVITKANIVKHADGNFQQIICDVAEREYPDITVQTRLVDATAAKLMDPDFNKDFQVIVLPNLYGDIVTDIAAEHQGGLGSAASANLGSQHALFEAIHGTAPTLAEQGLSPWANPCSVIRAAGLLVGHIGFPERRAKLEQALDICCDTERRVVMGFGDGPTSTDFTDYLIETIQKLG